jgi:hypothetical protein
VDRRDGWILIEVQPDDNVLVAKADAMLLDP